MFGKKGLHLNRNGLKQFAKNLIDATRELWKVERPFCDLTQNDTNKLIETQISSNLWITTIENNNILHNFNDVNSNLNIFTESEKLETESKHINRKDSNFDLHDLVKLQKDYEKNRIIASNIGYLKQIWSYKKKYL